MVRNHTNQDFFDHEEITITRACLKNHSRNLHVPLCGRFCRKSFSNTLWFVTGKKDLVKMWFDISGADIIQSYLMIPVSKGQKAVRACTIRLLNLGHAKYEKVAIYAVNQRISNIWRIAGAA